MKTLKQYVEDCGNQKTAAEKIGVERKTVQRILKGTTKKPRPLLIRRLKTMGIVL